MHGVYIGQDRMLVRPKWGGMMVLSASDLSLTPILVVDGVYEPALTQFFAKNVRKGDTFLDLGANQGYFTVLAGYLVGSEGRVISYEANPAMYRFIRDNVNLNYLKVQVKVINKAVYSRTAELSFNVTERFPSNSSLFERNGYLDDYVDHIQAITVQAEALDSHFEELSHVHMIKMDVEGAEYDAFLGMEKLLRSGKVDCVVFEWNRDMLGERADLCVELLESYQSECKMEFYVINNEGDLVPIQLRQITDQMFYPSVVLRHQ